MSLISVEVRCNWPGCGNRLHVQIMQPTAQERGWKVQDSWTTGMHLCPNHAGHGFDAVGREISRALGIPDDL